MKGLYLTEKELIELRAAHREAKRCGSSSSAYKINAIILLGTGWTFVKVKEALLLDEDTLSRYVERYKQGGISCLIETQYTGRQCLLSADEIEIFNGAINAETHEITVIESETVNAYSTINLFTAIEQKYPCASEVVIILDNAKYHYSKEIKEYLNNGSRIRLVFLPSYSPNLNLITPVRS